MRRIHTPDDLALAELCAARLDGELYEVDACFASVALPDDALTRASAFAWSVSDSRIVAERLTAAWIWGARSRAPAVLQACAGPGTRARASRPRLRVRETRLTRSDVVVVGPARVTAPLRTAVDLLRDGEWWERDDAEAVRRLTALVHPDAIRTALAATRSAPHSRQAVGRLEEALR
ncbi:hypothetical protein [Curtobacterium sp. MCBD17_003]|uniref:hypothetical protein n=1 Tax=Curtobacterium sp. MCBD17_003 TaxID=2175667 RepID=UPI000DA7BEAA|nr:hypothetical protein [Curtobacterium sp. MCBD17_003]WIE53169.1 hypothetical protein DEI88_008285 [Curtobacterium sp. MCBD17_003]